MKTRPASAERRRHILRTALACFERAGYEGTTTRLIQREAGISVGSFYHHFGSKAGLASALFLEGLRDKNRLVLETLADTPAVAEDSVKAVVRAHVRWIVEHPQWARFLYGHRGAAVRDEAAGAELNRINREFSKVLMARFGPFLEDGSLRELPRESYSVILLGPVQEFARRWLAGRAESDPETLAPVFADAAWRALRGHP